MAQVLVNRTTGHVVDGHHGFGGLRTIEDNQALLETIAVETLAIENSISRNAALTRIVVAAAKLIELGDLTTRLAAVEAALTARRHDEGIDAFPESG